MTYIVISALIILFSSVRALSFAVWQFKNKNIFGGIMVSLLALAAAVMIFMQFYK